MNEDIKIKDTDQREDDLPASSVVAIEEKEIRLPPMINLGRLFIKKLLYFVTIMGPDLLLALFMALLLIITTVGVGGHIKFAQATLLLPVLITSGLIGYRGLIRFKSSGEKPEIITILRDWLPFLFIAFIYENLHGLGDYFYTYDYAEVFQNWDIALFGVEPTLWIQKFHSPLLTDIMSISYALYLIFALIIMFFLSHQNRHFKFREISLALTFTFIMGFIGYVVWSTSPPRYFITEEFTNPVHLKGIFIFELFQGAWDSFSATGYGAFPSLHVGISSVALLYAWKFRNISKLYRWIWRIYIPLIISLWISTVYLRHHWVIDIFAGWLVAAVAFLLSEHLLTGWQKLRSKFGLSE